MTNKDCPATITEQSKLSAVTSEKSKLIMWTCVSVQLSFQTGNFPQDQHAWIVWSHDALSHHATIDLRTKIAQRCAIPKTVASCQSRAIQRSKFNWFSSWLGVTSVTSVISADLPSILPLRKLDQAMA